MHRAAAPGSGSTRLPRSPRIDAPRPAIARASARYRRPRYRPADEIPPGSCAPPTALGSCLDILLDGRTPADQQRLECLLGDVHGPRGFTPPPALHVEERD